MDQNGEHRDVKSKWVYDEVEYQCVRDNKKSEEAGTIVTVIKAKCTVEIMLLHFIFSTWLV